jgi:hypothetical protein
MLFPSAVSPDPRGYGKHQIRSVQVRMAEIGLQLWVPRPPFIRFSSPCLDDIEVFGIGHAVYLSLN